ncbi:hypothetical protein BN903_335 [Halorubrum sp. AJ67]|nr:hypothetical protein BN903_335 [Halorubrum sp. AJ67]
MPIVYIRFSISSHLTHVLFPSTSNSKLVPRRYLSRQPVRADKVGLLLSAGPNTDPLPHSLLLRYVRVRKSQCARVVNPDFDSFGFIEILFFRRFLV